MKFNKNFLFQSILISMLTFGMNACTEEETTEAPKCTADACDGANTLLACDPVTGTARQIQCQFGCMDNKCIETPPAQKCTADVCNAAGTAVLVCDPATGTVMGKQCANGCRDGKCIDLRPSNSCSADKCLSPTTLYTCDPATQNMITKTCPLGCVDDKCVEPCTADLCKNSSTLLSCDKATGKTTEKVCGLECRDNACVDKCRTDVCKDGSTLLSCDAETGRTTETECEVECRDNACVDRCTADLCKNSSTLLSCDTASGRTTETECEVECRDNRCVDKCTASVCKDDKNLIMCDTATGRTSEVECELECKDNTCINKCRASVCKDDKTLLACNSMTGMTSEITCGLECKDGTCIDRCTATRCSADGKSLLVCDSDTGRTTEQKCANGCLDEKCLEAPIEVRCSETTPPTCIDSNTLILCEDPFYEGYKPYTKHCVNGRTCRNVDGIGACMEDTPKTCQVDSCKDLTTLNVCVNGSEIETPCGKGKICIENACVDAGNITVCKADNECGKDNICHDGLCYTKANMEMPIGAKCDPEDFMEYCKDGFEYKCGYEHTVEKSDCADYNGCAMIVQLGYRSKKPIRNATCRGTSDRLIECTKPGITNYQCFNEESDVFPIHMSLGDGCVRATNGEFVHFYQQYQYNCGESISCNETTGLCPGATITCPTGDPSCSTPVDKVGQPCDMSENAYCADDQNFVYCNDNVWTKFECPATHGCAVDQEEALCLERCSAVGEKSSLCSSGFFLETVCKDFGTGKFQSRIFDSLQSCECKDSKTCK